MGQSFTIRILPSRSRMVALISPTFSFSSTLTSFLPSRIACRASRVHVGQSESVSRGQPSGGFVFSYDFRSGLSDHAGVNDGFCLILFSVLKTVHAPLAATDRPFSTYLIGLCIAVNLRGQKAYRDYISSERARRAANGPLGGPDGHAGASRVDGKTPRGPYRREPRVQLSSARMRGVPQRQFSQEERMYRSIRI